MNFPGQTLDVFGGGGKIGGVDVGIWNVIMIQVLGPYPTRNVHLQAGQPAKRLAA